MRLIDADDLIEKIKEQYNPKDNNAIVSEIVGDIINNLLCEQPTIRDWTSCNEKLPTDGIVYELSCRYLNQDYVTIGYCKDGKPVHSYIDDNSMFKHSEVIAWRKFGEPYREETK